MNQSYDENIINYQPPSDLQPITSRPSYSPIHTPPRLRMYVLSFIFISFEIYLIFYLQIMTKCRLE
jgi:hypothetical protein